MPNLKPGTLDGRSTIILKCFADAVLFAFLFAPVHSVAQQADSKRNVMVVFDASGSMWGHTEGRAKIEVAYDVLSSVLEEAAADS